MGRGGIGDGVVELPGPLDLDDSDPIDRIDGALCKPSLCGGGGGMLP